MRNGWTRTAIERYLGEPDIRQAKPPLCGYSAGRVLQANGCERIRRASKPPETVNPGPSADFVAACCASKQAGKIGAQQRAILSMLEREDVYVGLGEIVSEVWKRASGRPGEIPHSFYESIRRAAVKLESRELIHSGRGDYRQRYRIGGPERDESYPPKRIPGSVIDSKILEFLAVRERRYSDVVRVIQEHLFLPNPRVVVCRSVKRLAAAGKIRRQVKKAHSGSTYEVLLRTF